MPEQLKIEIVDGILQASASGPFSLDSAKTSFQEILRVAREENVDKILVDARGITTEIPAMARYDFAVHMSEQRLAGIKIALVGRSDAVWPDHFLENVALNRNVNTRVFIKVKEALDWLAE
jgi:hypothetical protein